MNTIRKYIDAALEAIEVERKKTFEELQRIATDSMRGAELTLHIEKLRKVKRELEQAWHEARR